MLAIESKNRTYGDGGRCFSSSSNPLISDQWEAPYVLQVRRAGGGCMGGLQGGVRARGAGLQAQRSCRAGDAR